MKPSAIIWIAQRFYENQEIADLLVANNICPLLDSSYAVGIWERLGKPETLRYIMFGIFTGMRPYWDEPISALGKTHIPPTGAIIGETSTETIQQLVNAGCKSITYTSYGWHLFRIAGINIRLDCFNQIPTWNRIKRKHKDKFKLCCVMIDKPERFESQIKWCMENGNDIMLIAPDKWNKEMPVEEMKTKLELFINVYKEVVNGSNR
jgi:hypothetical protein